MQKCPFSSFYHCPSRPLSTFALTTAKLFLCLITHLAHSHQSAALSIPLKTTHIDKALPCSAVSAVVARSGSVCEWVAELVEQNLCEPGGRGAAFPLCPQPLVPEASDITTEGTGWGNSNHLMLSDCSTCIKYTKLFLTVVCLTCSWRPLMKNAVLLQRNYPSA